jgi:hypothetical protein
MSNHAAEYTIFDLLSHTYHVSEYDPQSDRSKGDTKGIADGEEEGYIDGNGNGPPEG